MGRTFSTTLIQEPKNIVNAFDYLGMLVGLPRIVGERNDAYRKRLWDVYVHRAGAHQTGLINGLTRELGLKQYEALTVTYNGDPTNSPRVVVTDTYVYLYTNWNLIDESIDPNVEDGDPIDIFTEHGSAYYMGGLVDAINASTNFTASLANGVSEYALSACIFGQDSRTWVDIEDLQQVHSNKLVNSNIVPGSVTFPSNSLSTFLNQYDTTAEVVAAGDYSIDYTEGIIYSYTVPPVGSTCRYMYDSMPITLMASPVILHEFGSTEVQNKLFERILQADGTYIGALPTSTAIDYINELLAAHGMTWGA